MNNKNTMFDDFSELVKNISDTREEYLQTLVDTYQGFLMVLAKEFNVESNIQVGLDSMYTGLCKLKLKKGK